MKRMRRRQFRGAPAARSVVGRLTAVALVGAGALTAAMAAPAAPAQAASGDGALTVRVIRDMGANRLWDPVIDLPLAGVTVTVTDALGSTATLTTDASGLATLPAGDTRLSGGKYRVDVVNPDPAYYAPTFASGAAPADTPSATRLSSNQEFVDLSGGASATVTTGFLHGRDYCQSNPQVANACQPGIFNHAISDSVDTSPRDTVFLKNYTSTSYQALAQSADTPAAGIGTGTVYGIAYDRVRKSVFSAAYAKRNGAYGPLGPGGLYRTDPATGVTTAFATVPNAGTTPHDFTTVTNGGDEDAAFVSAVGKESLGAIIFSEDYQRLFVVNMADKRVYVYDATDTSGSATALTSFAIPQPAPACATTDDWRPMGLGQNDGTLYVGGVCSGETEATAADPRPDSLRAVVLTFDDTTYAATGQVLDQQLNQYTRGGDAFACKGDAGWYAWNDGVWCGSNGQSSVPVPMLGKIVVEANGDLNLAFRDRNADQGGVNLVRTVVGGGTAFPYTQVGGGLNRACLTNGVYVLDSVGGCGVAVTNPASTFYDTFSIHPNATFAGMTMSRAEEGLIIDEMDATGAINTQGIAVKNRGTGATGPTQTIGAASGFGTNYGKGQGLADMDVLCDLAPIQIGNRVWYNDAADGTQTAGENPVVGATVNLYDASGNLVATTTTNERGEYYFDSLTTPAIGYNTRYVVKMDNPADYAVGGPLERDKWDLSRTGTGPDANKATRGADGFPAIELTTGAAGENSHDYDFGFAPTPSIHIVKYDGRLPGPVNGPLSHANNKSSPTVYQAGKNGFTGPQSVKMIVTNDGNAVLGNVRVSDTTLIAPAMSRLTCDFSALGGPASGTTWAGLFQPGDSFPCTGTINLEAGQVHGDQINVAAQQYNPLTGQPVAGIAPVRDADRYYAKTGYAPAIVITKRDFRTKAEADTARTALFIAPNRARTIEMPVTNVGTAPVSRVVITDRTLSGTKVTNLRCTFPDGRRVKAQGGKVVWKASFGANPRVWRPGVTFRCAAEIRLKPGANLHGDRVSVTGSGPRGERLRSSDTYYARTGQVAGVPATGARVVPGVVRK